MSTMCLYVYHVDVYHLFSLIVCSANLSMCIGGFLGNLSSSQSGTVVSQVFYFSL